MSGIGIFCIYLILLRRVIKIMTDNKMFHEYTVEILYHFSCGVCSNWWSYAITPTELSDTELKMPDGIEHHCPHCGVAEKVAIKKGYNIAA